jgi:hypothetical protein
MEIEKKALTHRALYLKSIRIQYIFSSIENSEVVLVFERNDAGFKKLSSPI